MQNLSTTRRTESTTPDVASRNRSSSTSSSAARLSRRALLPPGASALSSAAIIARAPSRWSIVSAGMSSYTSACRDTGSKSSTPHSAALTSERPNSLSTPIRTGPPGSRPSSTIRTTAVTSCMRTARMTASALRPPRTETVTRRVYSRFLPATRTSTRLPAATPVHSSMRGSIRNSGGPPPAIWARTASNAAAYSITE